MADDLIAFLRARLDEDEAAAVSAADEPGTQWQYDGCYVVAVDEGDLVAVGSQDHMPQEQGAHIARHDPARVLADVEAKRRILGRHHDFQGWCAGCGNDLTYRTNDCPELRDLASVYADHPDYREEWRP